MRLNYTILVFVIFITLTEGTVFSFFLDRLRTKIGESRSNEDNGAESSTELARPADIDRLQARLNRAKNIIATKMRQQTPRIDKNDFDQMMKKCSRRVAQHVRSTGDNLEEVNEKLNVADKMYQGDIILTDEQIDEILPVDDNAVDKRQAFNDRFNRRKWSTVIYSYSDNLSAHAKVVSELAVKFWQENTCIDFEQRSDITNRIEVFQDQGCYSFIGKIGRKQELSLGIGCDSFGIAAHEFGHALGFFHAQSRHDRDSAIDLILSNVQDNFVGQFNKETTATNNNFNMPYDYGSIMHYGAMSASKNGQPTMRAKVPQYQTTMGSADVSFIDVSMMNTLYGCKDKCASTPTPCQNGGYPHPRNCTKCLCPTGFGGRLCNERPSGCGQTLTATKSNQILNGMIGSGRSVINDQFIYCNWRITAPHPTDRIQVVITRYGRNVCLSGCPYGGIELKWRKDTTLTGSRYCCPGDVSETLTSESNVFPVIAFNRFGRESFSLSYRIV